MKIKKRAILQNKTVFNKANQVVQNLMMVVEGRIGHPPRTEENYDWNVWSELFSLVAGGRYHLVYNPKHGRYYLFLFDIGDSSTNPNSRWLGFRIVVGDFDNNPNTMVNVELLDRKNRLYSVN
jgi:hypothetical protein